MPKTSKQLRLPFTVSKAKLQTFFLNEAGQTISRTTFKKYSGLLEFCQQEFNMSELEYRKRKAFFGHEVEAILSKFNIEFEELYD